jgi:hypothetical protein
MRFRGLPFFLLFFHVIKGTRFTECEESYEMMMKNKTVKSVKKQYRILSRTMHPDKGGNSASFITFYNTYETALSCAREDEIFALHNTTRPERTWEEERWDRIMETMIKLQKLTCSKNKIFKK